MDSSEEKVVSPERIVCGLSRYVVNQLVSKKVDNAFASELRRARAGDLSSPSFWRLYRGGLNALQLPSAADFCFYGMSSETTERRLGVFFSVCALLGELAGGAVSLGASLAMAGMSEARFVRLMRATNERLEDEIIMAARFLVSKGQSLNPEYAALLLLSDNEFSQMFSDIRHRIARDFYQSID